MPKFEILCVTMHQTDFSKIEEMNIHSDVLFANQASTTGYDEMTFGDNKLARMVTTETRGVGKNRNLALIYANADICLLADDDMVYDDDVEQIVVNEFEELHRADAIIFNVITDSKEHPQVFNKKQKRMTMFSRNPYGAVRIAFRLNKIRRSNIWFTTMFGGGAPYPCGEDSMFIRDMMKKGMKVYVSNKVIGRIKFEASTWYTGMDERFFAGKGSYIQATRKGLWRYMYAFYYAYRTRKRSNVPGLKKVKSMIKGMNEYKLSG